MTLRKRWGRDPRCWILWVGALGLAIGFWLSWLINRPWLESHELRATYRLASHGIHLQGHHHVNRECDGESLLGGLMSWLTGREPTHPVPVWRNQAIATDGQVALYAPVPDPPPLTKGEHHFVTTIPLLAEIYPDGWTAQALVTCAGETPETAVSPIATVILLDLLETPP